MNDAGPDESGDASHRDASSGPACAGEGDACTVGGCCDNPGGLPLRCISDGTCAVCDPSDPPYCEFGEAISCERIGRNDDIAQLHTTCLSTAECRDGECVLFPCEVLGASSCVDGVPVRCNLSADGETLVWEEDLGADAATCEDRGSADAGT